MVVNQVATECIRKPTIKTIAHLYFEVLSMHIVEEEQATLSASTFTNLQLIH